MHIEYIKAMGGGGPNFFFLKINNGFYMKANFINCNLIFTELKTIINF